MATGDSTKKSCCKCNKNPRTVTCDGCHRVFCFEHVDQHRQELSEQLNSIGQEYDVLKRDISTRGIERTLLTQIDSWEKEAIEAIQDIAKTIRTDAKRVTEKTMNQLLNLMNELWNELSSSRLNDEYTEDDLDRWMKQLKEFRKQVENPSKIGLLEDISSFLYPLKNISLDGKRKDKADSNSQNVDRPNEERNAVAPLDILSTIRDLPTETTSLSNQPVAYPCILFSLDESTSSPTGSLFVRLMNLRPMEKSGAMSGRCELETAQMEHFLTQTFGFKNIPEEYIVPGVKSFLLSEPPHKMVPRIAISFPGNSTSSFTMSIQEIIEWQRSYKVYADKNIKGMDQAFLRRALQGQSVYGEEAFRMKFVVRISTCPILMEFDAKVISRSVNEDWPNRIKLVSVTGIDFAGRIHDVGDIFYYISNWRDVFDMDPKSGLPIVHNGRDFNPKNRGPPAELREQRVLDSLIRMARLRLRACDEEGVQIVVETGIGLGVFSGKNIGIDRKIRALSAEAIRTVLEQDESSYKNILAVVFALPRFSKTGSSQHIPDTFDVFVDEFRKSKYTGVLPVLIADQDMHRLTVAIARQGFTVSELNPTDSHGVFGEYWQNRGLAVEEKLALTTVGLLVQHHLINTEVFNPKNYHLVETTGGGILDWETTVLRDNQ